MRNNSRSNVLLVEILIAVLFFMLSATVLIRVFATARNMTVRSGVESAAIADAQNVAEVLYASEDRGDYTLYVSGDTTSTEGGELWSGTVSAFYKLRNPEAVRLEDEELFSLTCTRYKGVAAQ